MSSDADDDRDDPDDERVEQASTTNCGSSSDVRVGRRRTAGPAARTRTSPTAAGRSTGRRAMKTIHHQIRAGVQRRTAGARAGRLATATTCAASGRGRPADRVPPVIAEPPLGAPLEERVAHDRDAHDHDHAHRQGVAEARVVEHVAADLAADQDGDDVDRAAASAGRPSPARRRRCRTAGSSRRGATASGSAGRRSRQYWTRRRAHVLGRLAPVLLRPSMAGAMIRTMSGNWKYR